MARGVGRRKDVRVEYRHPRGINVVHTTDLYLQDLLPLDPISELPLAENVLLVPPELIA